MLFVADTTVSFSWFDSRLTIEKDDSSAIGLVDALSRFTFEDVSSILLFQNFYKIGL